MSDDNNNYDDPNDPAQQDGSFYGDPNAPAAADGSYYDNGNPYEDTYEYDDQQQQPQPMEDGDNNFGYEDPYGTSNLGTDDPDADPSYYGNQSQYSMQSGPYEDDPYNQQQSQYSMQDDEYYYDNDEEYYDDEGKPLSGSQLGGSQAGGGDDYYNDEYPDEHYYYDEDDEERRRRARRRRAWCCCLILLCCLLILIILLIIFLLSLSKKDGNSRTDPPTYAPFVDDTDDDYYYDDDIILAPGVKTTPMAPYNRDCRDSEGDDLTEAGFRNVWDQCECAGEIYFVPQDVQDLRELVLDRVGKKFYDNLTLPLESCDPVNMAAIWLASGDVRDAGEPRQRFASAVTFFQLNGTIWDYHNEWLSDLNECLWMGIQCNNRDTVNSLQLDTNNLFGYVSMIALNLVRDVSQFTLVVTLISSFS
jgi:hypothetical protein